MAQYRHETKCIYCQKSVTKRNRSVEHVMPKCMLQANIHALTLKNHVCRDCNSSFYFETFFSELTDIALMNQQVKADLDRTTIPEFFFTENFSKRRINGREFLKPYISSVQIEPSISDRSFMGINFDGEAETELMRGIAKIALNALLVKPQRKSKDFLIVEYERGNYSGHEHELTHLKKFIKGEIINKKTVNRIEDLNDPLLIKIRYDGVEDNKRIRPNEVFQTMHMVDIHRCQDLLYCFITLFLGLENPGAVYSVFLNRDFSQYPVENLRGQPPTRLRTIHFYYHLSKDSEIQKREFESCLIQSVNDPMLVGIINNTRN